LGRVVIAGHFGFAAAVKAKERTTPLWALMLACVWLDVIFVPLFAAGIEKIVMIPGAKEGAYGDGVIYADYTHSLVGAFVLSALLGLALGARYGKRSGIVIGLVGMSHWVLDLVMHRQDMPILPGNAGNLSRLGFGLWRSHTASAALELAFVAVGAWMYWRAAREVDGPRANVVGIVVAASGVVVLVLSLAGL
jgi:membrane-bound metal-dependent hydrolase YbcI (DUF457 family)